MTTSSTQPDRFTHYEAKKKPPVPEPAFYGFLLLSALIVASILLRPFRRRPLGR